MFVKPKSQGGIGLRMLSEWNEALMMKHLWNIEAGKETLWVKWVHAVKLKGQSIWQVNNEYNDRWMWKNILELRTKVRSNIVKEIGNGLKTNMWYDQWCKLGIIADIVTTRSIHNDRLSLNMLVNELIVKNRWRWTVEWECQYLELANLDVSQLSTNEDVTKWRCNDGRICEFSSKIAWEHISHQKEKVRWNKVVWYSQCNPRMAFILWMAIKGRPQTQDRIIKWNNDPNMKCSLCKKVSDSHTHLFFECEYSRTIWEDLKVKMECGWMSNTWEILIEQFISDPCNNTIRSVLKRFGRATSVYHVWKEMNSRVFTGAEIDSSTLMKIIEDNIKMQVMSLKVKKSAQVLKISKRWNVDWNLLKAE